jgi:glycosyltransferase involved in cell wall biosynthesis
MSKAKVRVLCVARDLRGGGAERIQLTLLEHFDREKFDIQLFYLSGLGVLHDLIPPDITPVYGVPGSESLKLRMAPLLVRLTRLAARSDVIFAMQEGAPMYLAALAGLATRRPVVTWLHVCWSVTLQTSRFWHRRASALLYSLTNTIIVVSNGVGDDLAQFAPGLRPKIIALRNPLRLQQIRRQATAPLPPWTDHIFSKKTILAVGRLTPQKGFDLLITAFAELIRRQQDLHLLILGDGEDRLMLEGVARACGVQDRVFMPGFQQNPYRFFSRAEAFVLSSRWEGLSMVILEAMALRLPVIATDCPHGPREITNHGECGVLVPPGDAAALADAIYHVINSPERRPRLCALGVERAEEYEVRRSTASFEDVLLRVARNGRDAVTDRARPEAAK